MGYFGPSNYFVPILRHLKLFSVNEEFKAIVFVLIISSKTDSRKQWYKNP